MGATTHFLEGHDGRHLAPEFGTPLRGIQRGNPNMIPLRPEAGGGARKAPRALASCGVAAFGKCIHGHLWESGTRGASRASGRSGKSTSGKSVASMRPRSGGDECSEPVLVRYLSERWFSFFSWHKGRQSFEHVGPSRRDGRRDPTRGVPVKKGRQKSGKTASLGWGEDRKEEREPLSLFPWRKRWWCMMSRRRGGGPAGPRARPSVI